jgi:hypothetical protein
VYQGTAFRQGDSPIMYLDRPAGVSDAEQRNTLELLKTLNQRTTARYPADTELEARLRSYDLAYRMQKSAPDAVDLSRKPRPPRSSTASTTSPRWSTAPTCCARAAWWRRACASCM